MAIQISGNTVIHDSQDVQVSGVVTATSFHGDASQLTNLPAAGSSLQATASGTLSDGSTVIINTDGTVSAVGVTTVSTPKIFTTTNFGGSPYDIKSVYDTSSNKVVIVYRDTANSNYGTAILGTVSGNSITFGTPHVFLSYSAPVMDVAYSSSDNKILISLRQGTSTGAAGSVVAITVDAPNNSFTSSNSYGTEYWGNTAEYGRLAYYPAGNGGAGETILVFTQGYLSSDDGKTKIIRLSGTTVSMYNASDFATVGREPDIVYDSNSNRLVVAYKNSSNQAAAKVGSISGDTSGSTISWGSETTFDTSTLNDPSYMELTIDTNRNKIVALYRVGSKGFVAVGTVNTSNNTINFATPVEVYDDSNNYRPAITFDPSTNKVIVSADKRVWVGDIDSSGIITFDSGTWQSTQYGNYPTAVYDPGAERVIISQFTYDPGGVGESLVFSPESRVTNATSENFIGISNGAYTNGQTATIQLIGSVDDAQSGLTPGQRYFLQGDGTLSETTDSEHNLSISAGKAISSTKLVIKG